MSAPTKENTRSKRLLLVAMDDYIQDWINKTSPDSTPDRRVIEQMIMNRNRIARFFDQEVRLQKSYDQEVRLQKSYPRPQ